MKNTQQNNSYNNTFIPLFIMFVVLATVIFSIMFLRQSLLNNNLISVKKEIARTNQLLEQFLSTKNESATTITSSKPGNTDKTIYINKEYGFSVQFPADWYYKSPAYSPSTIGGVDYALGIVTGKEMLGDWSFIVGVASQNVNDLLKNPEYTWNKSWKIQSQQQIQINNLTVERVLWSNSTVVYYIQHPTKKITLSFDGPEGDKIIDLISTLEFIGTPTMQ